MSEETFIDVLCRFRHQFRLIFMVSVLSVVILGTALTVIEGGTDTYVITVLQLLTLVIIGSFSFGMMVLCARK